MKKAILILSLLILPFGRFGARAWGGSQFLVKVHPSAWVNGGTITLGEISEIKGPDPSWTRRLSRIRIGKAPMPGSSRIIYGAYIAMVVRDSGIPYGVSFPSLPKEVNIRCRVQENRDYQLRPLILRAMEREGLLKDQGRLKIREMSLPESIIIPRGRYTVKVDPLSPIRRDGELPVKVRIIQRGEVVKLLWLNLRMALLREVVVARSGLLRGVPISKDDLSLKEVDLFQAKGELVYDPKQVIGKSPRRNIPPGTPITLEILENSSVIKRGDIITLLIEARNLRIRALGKALQRGYVGKMIKAINVDSKKVVYGEVIDSKTIRIPF